MKIVLDTNVLVSAVLSPDGHPAMILNLLLNDELTLCIDSRITGEYACVLMRKKFGFDRDDVDCLLNYLLETGEQITANPVKEKFNDPDDRKFYEVFRSSDADYLVTGNLKDFAHLKEKKIVSPKAFIEKYLKL